jgi:hypothetical protein
MELLIARKGNKFGLERIEPPVFADSGQLPN